MEQSDILLGDASQVLVATFGDGLEILVDPYTLGAGGNVRVIGSICADAVLLQDKAFAVGKVATE